MSVRTSSNEYLQVVFLIDENPSSIYDGITAKKAANSVCLCVLRILTYFNELRNQNSSSLLSWGFKFYNSRSLNQRYQRHNFKELCVSEFDTFEKDVNYRFNEEVRNQTEEQNEEICSDDEFATNSNSNTSTIKPTSSKSLTCALTDLVHDFQWEINDLNSPLRTTRQSNLRQQNSRETRNIVFLLTKCPTSFDSLREFNGSKIEDLNTLRNAIMSSALLKEFNDVYKINLNWINTDCSESCVMVQGVVDMMGAFLQIFNGSLIPLRSLVCVHPTSLPGELNMEHLNSSAQCSPLVPVVSVLSQYMRELKYAGTVDQSCIGAMKVQNSDDREVQDCSNLWIGWLCSPGVKPMAHCTLQLSSMLSSNPSKICAGISIKDPTLVTKQQSNSDNTVLSPKISMPSSDNPSSENVQKNCPNLFWIKGAARREKICPSWFHLTKVYSCVAMVAGQGNETSSSALSGWFQRLMMTLAKQNLSLVIELRDPESGSPITSVLHPLTSICAVLSVVNSCKLLMLEKLLLWNKRKSSTGIMCEDPQYLVENLDIPKTTDGRRVRVLTPSDVHCSLSTQSSDASASVGFSAQDLNNWSLGLACLDQGSCIMPQTSSATCSDEGSSQESSLIKKLKELYSSKRTEQLGLTDKKAKPKRRKISQRHELTHEQVQKELQQQAQPLSSHSKETKADVLPSINSSSKIPSNNGSDKDNNVATCTSNEEKKEIKIMLDSLQLNANQDLKDFLQEAYHQALTDFQMESLTRFIDKCGAVTDWYLRKCDKTEAQKLTMQSVLTDHLLLSNFAIREKYDRLKTSGCKQTKLTEYQLQVLLRLEIICTGDKQQCDTSMIDEVVIMLRSISFIKDPGFLRDFLKEIILTRYVQHIPKFLCEIYEGLMQDLPLELLSPSKQNSEEEESPLKRCQIPLVVRPESDQPSCHISRPITRHRSIADIGGKRREIVVPGKAKTKVKTGKRKHDKRICVSSNEKSDHHEAQPQKTPVKKVCRNLFTEGEEKTEVNSNSTGLSKNKLKVPSIFTKEEKSRHHRHKDSRRHSVAGGGLSKVVRETPGRRQIPNALFQKQHRARKRTSTITELNIVQESPLKEILAAETLLRRSPRRHPGSIFQRSQSFYGQNPNSCPLIRTRSSSSTLSGSPIKKLELDENSDASKLATDTIATSTTPVKTASDNVKESPLRFSPRIRKRFTLHTLLAERATTKTEREYSSRKTKALTPKSKQQAPVRSSPRLLKRRSFSCIGFSDSSLILNPKCNGGDLDRDRKITTPSKKKVLTPTRSSPRFKKNASDSCQVARNQEALSSLREQDRVNPELRKRLLQSPTRRVGLSSVKSVESASTHLGKRTSKEFTESLMDSSSLTESNISAHDETSEDSEVILNFNKQSSSAGRSPSSEELGPDTSNTRSPTREHDVANDKASLNGNDHFKDALPYVENGASMDLVDSDTSKDEIFRVVRPNQSTTSFNHECENTSSQARNNVRCNSDYSGDTERDVLSRKRLSFSPSKGMKISRGSSDSMLGCLDNENDKNESYDKRMVQNEDAPLNRVDGLDSRQTEISDNPTIVTRTGSDDPENSAAKGGKVFTPLRKSPRKHLTKDSPVCGSQTLLLPKPVSSTPPPKKQKKTRGQTEQESKRSSPLNQILKQRKRNRPEGHYSSNNKRHSDVSSVTVAQKGPTPHMGPRDTISEEPAEGFLAEELLDECSRSSEDMVFDWLTDIDGHENTAMGDIPQIHAQKGKGLDLSFEEDDNAFRNASISLRSRKKSYKPTTPISAKSIQTLRDSPLLVNSSSFNVPQGSMSKKWSDLSPKYGKERLKRRKRSEAFGGHSSEVDTSTGDDGESKADSNNEKNSTRSRKTIKLETN